MNQIRVGIVTCSGRAEEDLGREVRATGMATIAATIVHESIALRPQQITTFADSRPELIIVDLADEWAAVQCLQVLQPVLPNSAFFVVTNQKDAEVIIKAVRAGAREFIPRPAGQKALTDAFTHYLRKGRPQGRHGTGRIYAVMSTNSGAGATCLAINAAIFAAELTESKVALFDLMTPVGDVATYLYIAPKYTIAHVVEAGSRLDSALLDNFMTAFHRVHVLPGWEHAVATEMYSYRLEPLLHLATESYGHIFLDVPFNLSQEQLKVVIEECSTLLIPVTPEIASVWRADRLLRLLDQVGGRDKVQLVLNRWRRMDQIDAKQIEEALKLPVSWKLPNDYATSIRAINSGKPIAATQSSELSRSIQKLTAELIGVSVPARKPSWIAGPRTLMQHFLSGVSGRLPKAA
jgi:pilus assembly protein CpaE